MKKSRGCLKSNEFQIDESLASSLIKSLDSVSFSVEV